VGVKSAAALLIVAALALGAAGCGGGGGGSGRLSKSQYESKLRSLQHDLTPGLESFAAFKPTDLAAAPAFLTKVADTLDGVAASLRGVKPPKDVQGLHDRLIEGSSGAATELRMLVHELNGASPAQTRRLLAQFDPARLAGLQELEQAASTLAAKGYRFS
jgi:hypothetical protein